MGKEIENAGEVITEKKFNKYTLAWQNLFIKEPSEPLKSFFEFPLINEPLVPLNSLMPAPLANMYNCVEFDKNLIHKMISSCGVHTIKAKFAIASLASGAKKFTIILYGIDSLSSRSSAFYMGTPSLRYIKNPLDPASSLDVIDLISDNLAVSWITNWNKLERGEDDNREGITSNLFHTRYGFLDGYSYDFQDFMNALYPPGTNMCDAGLRIYFSPHDHYSLDGTTKTKYTFGMVLRGAKNILQSARATKNQNNGENEINRIGDDPDDGDNSFYDLSLPSPPAT